MYTMTSVMQWTDHAISFPSLADRFVKLLHQKGTVCAMVFLRDIVSVPVAFSYFGELDFLSVIAVAEEVPVVESQELSFSFGVVAIFVKP